MANEDEFPMIEVMKMNDTEVRLFALLFHLVRYPNGLSFQRLRNIMPRYYKNEDIESDRKKLYRDLNQLKSLGFNIKVAQFGYQSEDHYPYYLEKDSIDKTLNFSENELVALSELFFAEPSTKPLQSLGQKLFSRDIHLFPKNLLKIQQTDETKTQDSTDIEKIIQAIKDKRAISIIYGFSNSERVIEPYRLIRKNAEDFYLIAYDRSREAIRRFVLPRIKVKRETKEDFISNKKLQIGDLNFHPLQLQVHDSESFLFEVHESYLDRWLQFLNGSNYEKIDQRFKVITTNKTALFNFYLQTPDIFLSADSKWQKELEQYLSELKKQYELV